VGVPIKDAVPERSKKAPILIDSAAAAWSATYPKEKAIMMIQSKTVILLIEFMLKTPLLWTVHKKPKYLFRTFLISPPPIHL
jgi:hypothetical protein